MKLSELWEMVPDLPEDNPLSWSMRTMIFIQIMTVVLLIVVLFVVVRVLKTKRETQKLLKYIKEYLHLAKGVRADTEASTCRVERAVAAVAGQTVDAIAVKAAAALKGDSDDTSLPVVAIPIKPIPAPPPPKDT